MSWSTLDRRFVQLLGTGAVLTVCSTSAASVQPVVAGAATDTVVTASYSGQPLAGCLGKRMETNLAKTIMRGYSVEGLLRPFKARFEGHGDDANWPNGGEYAGKNIEAGVYAWKFSGDPAIKARIDSVVDGLIAYQGSDGYMGTASPENRWGGQGWDVWMNKYCLKGLLAYYRETGDSRVLDACGRLGDLMCNTFGPGKPIPNIDQTSGWYGGLPSTAILESMAVLYRYTGRQRYLDFCNYLLTTGSIGWVLNRTPNPGDCIGQAKVYEVLIAYIGLLEMYRITGEAGYLNRCLNLWDDLVKEHRGSTGTVQIGDHTGTPYDFNPTQWTETCNAVTWMELNWHLFRITGHAKYAQEMELTVYNHLLGCENPRTGGVGNMVPVNGSRGFNGGPGGGGCCGASLIRGIAAIPEWCMAGSIRGNIAIANYFPSKFTVALAQPLARTVAIDISTRYPEDGVVRIGVTPSVTGAFTLMLRVPVWCQSFVASCEGVEYVGAAGDFLSVPRVWGANDTVTVTMDLSVQRIDDRSTGSTLKAIQRGPQVLSLDPAVTSDQLPAGWIGSQLYAFAVNQGGQAKTWYMVPYADAGQTGSAPTVFQSAFTLDATAIIPARTAQSATAHHGASSRILTIDGRTRGRNHHPTMSCAGIVVRDGRREVAHVRRPLSSPAK